MSKEEILDIGENGYNVDQLGCVFLKDFVLDAMDEYAKQKAIGFKNWHEKSKYARLKRRW